MVDIHVHLLGYIFFLKPFTKREEVTLMVFCFVVKVSRS